MTPLPVPKFTIGQIVWLASAAYEQRNIPCPDCLGQRSWSVTTPAGESFESPCPTCERGFGGSTGCIAEYHWSPSVRALTVGSVRIDTSDDPPIRYMAHETGVGSGSLWGEDQLHADYGAAVTAADACVAERKRQADEEERKRHEQVRNKGVRKPRKAS